MDVLATVAAPVEARIGLHWIDWLLIGIYAVSVVLLGCYYSRRQNSTSEYYTGDGKMSPMLIGISLFVTLLSTISYLARPGEIIKHGPVAQASLLALPFSYLVVGYVLLPKLMRQRVTSAYELLEGKLGGTVRVVGAVMFILLRLVWMSLLLYLTSSVLAMVIHVDDKWVPVIALISGFIAVLYTSIGGLRTVIITDFFQFACLFLGGIVTIGIVTWRMGGVGWFPTEWVSTWDTQPVFSPDPRVRVTLTGALLSGFLWTVATAGGDQTAIQRFMSTKDAKAARRAYLIQMIAGIAVAVMLMLVGVALLGYFQANPHLLPEDIDLVQNGDDIFPIFIASYLPVGLAGLIVAALFAAAMSSIDSGVNSITAVVQTDFLDRLGRQPQTEAGHVRFAKVLAFVIGIAIVLGSSVMQYVPGNYLEVTQKTTNLLVTPIFGLFIMALFVPWATAVGTLAGGAVGIAVAALIGFWDVITGGPTLSFQWISACALTANLAVACLVSALSPQAARQ